MNIDEMSDEEKSEHLFVLCGWYRQTPAMPILIPPGGKPLLPGEIINLYDPANMALAWRVLSWAWSRSVLGHWIGVWWKETGAAMTHPYLPACGPAEAQRIWLDKILSLAIDAGGDTAVSQEAP